MYSYYHFIAPPSNLHVSHIDIGLIQLTFTWSPVSRNYTHSYNIQASNCGNCPTSTNHTYATCKNVPTNGNTCIFAIWTVICDDVVGNKSASVNITVFNSRPTSTEFIPNDPLFIAGIGFLITSLFICLVMSAIMTITLTRNRLRFNFSFSDSRSQDVTNNEQAPHMVVDYDDVDTYTLPSFNQLVRTWSIDTWRNVAYGHEQLDSKVDECQHDDTFM